jgi:hypothetical protein
MGMHKAADLPQAASMHEVQGLATALSSAISNVKYKTAFQM